MFQVKTQQAQGRRLADRRKGKEVSEAGTGQSVALAEPGGPGRGGHRGSFSLTLNYKEAGLGKEKTGYSGLSSKKTVLLGVGNRLRRRKAETGGPDTESQAVAQAGDKAQRKGWNNHKLRCKARNEARAPRVIVLMATSL